jgi:hypothetical protein
MFVIVLVLLRNMASHGQSLEGSRLLPHYRAAY